MRKITTTIFLLFINFVFAQDVIIKKSEIKNVKDYLRSKDYSKKVIKELKTILTQMEKDEIIINESIPKEIFNISQAGLFSTKTKNYKILENNLVEINTLPNYEAFYEKIKNTVKNKNLEFPTNKINNRRIIRKDQSGNYLIYGIIELTSYEKINKNSVSATMEPYSLEYETKDFINYNPIRCKKINSQEWINID
ncbi:hypothetical protein MC916_002024 [Elizabethkingia anophelis]|uniref:hypothetical protein n=1 Tax=Elizabethkingia anophelis TaxID=1117645 RepID=UPI001DF4885E|nr:hypothetical protein [Elizabethkingia anophelis]EHM7980668.1 hypothetical protein [Elizabethkingia anophelis]EHM8031887.1 hypothetical protein [Elizabethkingia anophelis]EHZ9534841.1 hypothetical protein [Elizabethkingia anophelis]EKU3672752.1 hypothetical protein [Elizabethkingia anophelis]EKU4209729.1 hypothetical protein [Elizabethkingia anophelis]